MKGYYPDYYLRKRQREQAYRKVMFVLATLGILALAIATGYIIFSNVILPRRNAPGATETLAKERQDLETGFKLDENSKRPLSDGTLAESESGQSLDLNASAYALSFPLVQVSVDGSGAPAGQSPADGAGTTPGAVVPPSQDTATTPDAGSGAQSPGSADAPVVGSETTNPPVQPTKDAANKADKPSMVEKPVEKKKPDEKASKPQDKPVREEEKKPAPSVKTEEKKPTDSGKSGTGSGKKVYRVYAGLCKTRSDADTLKEKASSAGVSASVVKNGADYFILVGTVSSGDEALNLREKLIGDGFKGAFVTQKTE